MTPTAISLVLTVLVLSVFMTHALPKQCDRLPAYNGPCPWGDYKDLCKHRQCYQGPGEPCNTFFRKCNPLLNCDYGTETCMGLIHG